jgi:translation elongation factor EF-Tu-like GTPase
MHRLYSTPDDFEAVIRIFSETVGGRKTPPFNGIRWDFSYASDPPSNQLYMIWPDFFSSSGDSLPTNAQLSIGIELPARMTVVVDEMREQIHRVRIAPGVEFYCHEGSKRVALGRVTRLTGLPDVRGKPQLMLAPDPK